jgi:predicted nuclease of predicted toxin-antitoxin system
MRDLGETWTDTQIWEHGRRHDLEIVSKDADFSDRAVVSQPPPRVGHIRFGNMKMRDFHALITRIWPGVVELSADHRLIRVFQDRIEAIA